MAGLVPTSLDKTFSLFSRASKSISLSDSASLIAAILARARATAVIPIDVLMTKLVLVYYF